MSEAGVETMNAKSVFSANLHETKNIMGQLMLRLDSMDAADSAVREARLLCQRVNDRMVQMLLLFELQNERLAPQMEAHNPADFLLELRENAKALAGDRLVIESSDQGAPDYWYFDRSLIEIALMNALHNALRHARSRVELRVGVRGDDLVFSVEDDGDGYPDAVLVAPRDQLQPVTRQGTGLGLYFSALIAQAHVHKDRPGVLELRNGAQGNGAVFSLMIP